MKFNMNCDEATTICDKNQYGEASFIEKIRLTFHLVFCKYCKDYTKQNNIMTKLFGKYLTPCDGSEKLTDAEKKELEIKLKEELKKK